MTKANEHHKHLQKELTDYEDFLLDKLERQFKNPVVIKEKFDNDEVRRSLVDRVFHSQVKYVKGNK